ncbi:MAG: tetratricopeptide repeat protein [Cyanobacteria bacterium P01_D01_bin.156]
MDKHNWYEQQKARLVYRRGCNLARQGNHQPAIALFTQSLDSHPNVADVYISRGLSYSALEQLDQAHHDFTAASSKQPAVACFQLGQLSYKQGDLTNAFNQWQQAIETNPNYTDAHYQLGLLHKQTGDNAAALVNFNRVLDINPNRADAYLQRGYVRQSLNDLAGAKADWHLATLNDASLALAVPTVAQPDGLAPVKNVLQQSLQPFEVTVKQQGQTLEISIRRQVGEGISYFSLPDQIRDLLLPLELSEFTKFKLIGYVGNVRGPEWEKGYDLYKGQPCPPCHWPTALAALVTFPPMGVTALLYASQVRRFYRTGQYPDALRASKAVRRLSLVGTGVMCVLASLPLGYTAITSIQNEPEPPVRTARAIDYDVYSN